MNSDELTSGWQRCYPETRAVSACLDGTTLRTGGILVPFRDGITHEEEKETDGASRETGTVTIKLFNLLIGELGPLFLERGIWVGKGEAEGLVKSMARYSATVTSACREGWPGDVLGGIEGDGLSR